MPDSVQRLILSPEETGKGNRRQPTAASKVAETDRLAEVLERSRI